MDMLRAFVLRNRAWAMFLVAVALCLKAALPAGYMIGSGARILTVEVCADASGEKATREIAVPADQKQVPGQQGHGKGETACPFSALTMVSLAGADTALLALALAFILALGFVPVRAVPHVSSSRLRPPLRGPPAFI